MIFNEVLVILFYFLRIIKIDNLIGDDIGKFIFLSYLDRPLYNDNKENVSTRYLRIASAPCSARPQLSPAPHSTKVLAVSKRPIREVSGFSQTLPRIVGPQQQPATCPRKRR